jgi:hypothetical protein
VGAATYKLALLASATLHPVFNVSQLKASHGTEHVSTTLPYDLVELQVPQLVLDRRWTTGSNPVEEVLIQWSRMPASLAT